MGFVRLKIREFAELRGWSVKEVARRTGIPYSSLKTYARSSQLATVDLSSVIKLAQLFEITVEELTEVVEE